MSDATYTQSAVPAWYEAFRPYLASLAYHRGYSQEETGDLLHQFFLELLEKGVDLRAVRDPRAYLATAFRHRLIDQYRRQKANRLLSAEALPDHYSEPCFLEGREQAQYNQELVQQIKKAMDRLPERCRRVICLKFYEGLSHDQIAERTGLSKRSVYNNLFEGIRILRREMTRTSPGLSYAALLTLLPLVLVP